MQNSILHKVIAELSTPESYRSVFHPNRPGIHMPSLDDLRQIVNFLRRVFFPGYFAHSEITPDSLAYYIGANVDKAYRLLVEQIHRGFCFPCTEEEARDCPGCGREAIPTAEAFIERLPEIRKMLATDARAAFEGDPAARSVGETIFCYPSLVAMTNHRIAHELYLLDVPIIPRIIAEMAHSETGIDIHPGATIGESCFIDHGTGVVIGETCVIGNRVQIYQGVTLGAKSFPKDANGNPIKGIPRHPILEDDVVIYSGATILGRITIGTGAIIGGNVWITQDVPAGARIIQGKFVNDAFTHGAGI